MTSRKTEEIYQRRFVAAGYFVLFALLILLIKLFYLQIVRHDYFWKLARARTFYRVSVPAPRGRIFDRRGVLLAGDRPSFNLYLDPYYLRGKEDRVLRVLARILDEDFVALKTEYILKKRKSYGEILFRRGLDWEKVARLEARRYYLPGVRVEAHPERFYPFGRSFFHLLGYVSTVSRKDLARLKAKGYGPQDVVGRTGLERAFEEVLRGKKGEREVDRKSVV